jgi:hypothetical protein
MNPNECFFFQPTDYTSSATVCKWCGKEKYQHKSEQKQLIIDIMNDDAKDGLYKQQTAVEWLVEMLNSKYGNDDFIISHINEIEQAKEMEKQQIIQTYHKSALNEATHIIAGTLHISAEQYYNEKYGKL